MARKTPLIADALAEYMATRSHCATNTLINDNSVLNGFVRHLGCIQVGHVTPPHVEGYFVGPAGIGQRMNAASYNKVLQRVRGFLTFCQNRGWNRQALLINVHPRRVQQQDRLRLTPLQLLRLLDLTDCPRDRCMLAVGMNLGLRASELTALRVGDLDLASGRMLVHVSKSCLQDQMPITSELDDELRRWLRSYAEDLSRFSVRVEGDMYLFPPREPSRLAYRLLAGQGSGERRTERVREVGPWKPHTRMTHPARIVQAALTRIGIQVQPGESFHTLRRSAGRAFFDAASAEGHDAALRMASAFLHHRSVQTTEGYLGLQHEKVKRDALLRGRPFLTGLIETSDVSNIETARQRRR